MWDTLRGLDPLSDEFTEALYNAFIKRMKSEGLFNEPEESQTSTKSSKVTKKRGRVPSSKKTL